MKFSRALNMLLQFSLFVFFASSLRTIAAADHWAQIAGALAAISLVLQRKQLVASWRTADTWSLFVLALWPIYQAIALMLWHGPWGLAHYLWFFVVAMLVAQALRLHRPPAELIFAALACAAIGAAWAAIHQVVFEGLPRARGHWYMINFGDWSLAMGLSSLMGCLLVNLRRRWYWLFLIGALAGLCASILSGTRGAWLALPIYLFLFLRQWRQDARSSHPLLIGIVCAACVVGFTGSRVAQRLGDARADIVQLSQGQSETSFGMRLVMWRIALDVAIKHPLGGIGPDGFQKELTQRMRIGKLSPTYGQFQHAHNELLDAAASGGVIKLTLVAAIYLIWLRQFRHASSRHQRPFQLAGVALVLSVFAFGLTEALFRDPLTPRLWPMVLAVLWAMCQPTVQANPLEQSETP